MEGSLGQWAPLLWFLLGFVSAFLLIRWINAHLQGLLLLLGADGEIVLYLQFVLFFPGILAHEVAHWIAAKLLGVKTLQFSVWPRKKGKGRVQYGSVRIASVDIVRSSLVGLAPFLLASVLIVLIGQYALGTESLRQVVASGNWGQIFSALREATRAPDFWLWLYLIFAISNGMFPSRADRESWKPLSLYLVFAVVVIYVSGWEPARRIIPQAVAQVANPLIYAFGITAAVDALFAAAIGLAETMVTVVRGKAVQYRPPR